MGGFGYNNSGERGRTTDGRKALRRAYLDYYTNLSIHALCAHVNMLLLHCKHRTADPQAVSVLVRYPDANVLRRLALANYEDSSALSTVGNLILGEDRCTITGTRLWLTHWVVCK